MCLEYDGSRSCSNQGEREGAKTAKQAAKKNPAKDQFKFGLKTPKLRLPGYPLQRVVVSAE